MSLLTKLIIPWCLALICLFQNCSGVNFSHQTADSASILGGTTPPGPPGSSTPSLNSPVQSLVCAAGNTTTSQTYYPTNCLLNPDLFANSLGVEMNNNYELATVAGATNILSIAANDALNGTSQDSALYVEFSTYLLPDTLVITAVDSDGNTTEILDVCNIGTYSSSDPSGGTERPYSDTILQFNVTVPAGTVSLDFDFTNALTPTYVGAWNLNEFSVALANPATNPFTGAGLPSNQFRVSNGPLQAYNDNADPLQAEPMCP